MRFGVESKPVTGRATDDQPAAEKLLLYFWAVLLRCSFLTLLRRLRLCWLGQEELGR